MREAEVAPRKDGAWLRVQGGWVEGDEFLRSEEGNWSQLGKKKKKQHPITGIILKSGFA